MLGNAIQSTMPVFRELAESNLVDTGDLQRRVGAAKDPENGQRIDLWETYWSGPMRVKVNVVEQQVMTGGQQVTILRAVVSVPVSAPAVATVDRVMPTASADARVVGTPLYVKAVQVGTQIARRKLTVTSEQG